MFVSSDLHLIPVDAMARGHCVLSQCVCCPVLVVDIIVVLLYTFSEIARFTGLFHFSFASLSFTFIISCLSLRLGTCATSTSYDREIRNCLSLMPETYGIKILVIFVVAGAIVAFYKLSDFR